jgi:PAS domain S-box-containing protein
MTEDFVLTNRTDDIVFSAARASFATDEENRIVAWNEAAEKLFGVRADDAIGRNLQAVIKARDVFGNRLCEAHCAFHQMVRHGEAPESFELDVFNNKDRKTRVAVSVVIVLGPEARTYRLIYMMTPKSRRRRADEAIDRLLAMRPELESKGTGSHMRGRRKSPILTRRQKEVLALLVLGRNSSEMADELGVSVHTVRSHVQGVLKALDVSSRLEAVSKAVIERIV